MSERSHQRWAGRSISPDLTRLAADRTRALALTPVSRETGARLNQFVELLSDWQSGLNLIAASTLESVWTRHIADSLQLIALAPQARTWVDLGSGAGFPGLVIGCALAEEPSAMVHLVESQTKKAAFLREAARITGAPAMVHAVRIEDFVETISEPPQVVTARALAPLERLLEAAYPLLRLGAHGIFPKGQNVVAELTQAAKCWNTEIDLIQSRTDPKAQIVVVKKIEPVPTARRKAPRTGGRGRSP